MNEKPKSWTLDEMEKHLHWINQLRGNHPLNTSEAMLEQALNMLRSQSAT
jgi:hypothetical protein